MKYFVPPYHCIMKTCWMLFSTSKVLWIQDPDPPKRKSRIRSQLHIWNDNVSATKLLTLSPYILSIYVFSQYIMQPNLSEWLAGLHRFGIQVCLHNEMAWELVFLHLRNFQFNRKPEVSLETWSLPENLKFTWKPEVYLKTWCFSLRFQVFRFHWNLKFTWKPEFYLETCSYWENEESVLSSKLTTFSTNSFSYTPCFRVLRSLKLGVYLETWGVHWKLNFTWKPVVTKKNTSLCFPLS